MCLRLEDGRDATSRKKRGGAVKTSPTHDETDTACREVDIFLKRRATLANKIAFYDTSLEMERFTRYISPTRGGGGGDGG